MDDWSAAFIKVVQAYSVLGYDATHIEAQKLIYFLNRAGQQLKCHFEKGPYGPNDQGMKFGIQQMEGHYVTGFGDGGLLEPVSLRPGVAEEADAFLAATEGAEAVYGHIDKVCQLIDGYETPYGLELLATVDWVVTQEHAANEDEAVRLSHAWSARKAKALREDHLRIAYRSLAAHGWI